MIFFLVLIALLLSFRHTKRKQKRRAKQAPDKALQQAARQRERDEKQRQREAIAAEKAAAHERKEEAAKQQAAADEEFLIKQIDKLYKMIWDADEELTAARQLCQHDREANKAGAVVPDKIANKHRAERDNLEKKVMQLERNIYSYETKLNKAQQIARN